MFWWKKEDNMHDQNGNFSRGSETVRINGNARGKKQPQWQGWKMPLMGSSADVTQMKKWISETEDRSTDRNYPT